MADRSRRAFPFGCGDAALCVLLSLFALDAAGSDDTANLSQLPHEERVRLLQERTWEIMAAPVQAELKIDGHLDDPAWDFAEPVTDFYQGESNEGLPATERTEIKALYDETNLYIGFRAYDSEPEKAKARAIFRDESPGADDLAIVMIDAFNDHRSAIQFVTNMNGVQIAFRKDVILLSLFQYNNDTKNLSSNIRFNWIPKPGSDFFIVYNELDDWARIFQTKNRSLVVKLNYLFAF